jgi:hypothetical protein
MGKRTGRNFYFTIPQSSGEGLTKTMEIQFIKTNTQESLSLGKVG